MLSIYNILANNIDSLISIIESKEHGNNIKEIIYKVRKTHYNTTINNIIPLFTKRNRLLSLPESLFI
jgi:site-specific DNA-adenine methylase